MQLTPEQKARVEALRKQARKSKRVWFLLALEEQIVKIHEEAGVKLPRKYALPKAAQYWLVGKR